MMKDKKQPLSRWFYGISVLVILFGTLISAWIFVSGIAMYPALIGDAYREDQHHLRVPGSKDVKLARTGAYGVYYEYSLVSSAADHSKMPPAIDCSLTSKSTGAEIEAVPDYVETNRYWSKDRRGTGVLIKSITVGQSDTYTFSCNYQDGSIKPEITVALGPNYVWEFLSVAGKVSLSLLGGISILFGSILVALIVVVVVAIKRRGL